MGSDGDLLPGRGIYALLGLSGQDVESTKSGYQDLLPPGQGLGQDINGAPHENMALLLRQSRAFRNIVNEVVLVYDFTPIFLAYIFHRMGWECQ